MAKFYRISGGSTQFKGVIPDIEFPGMYSEKIFGEEASEFALPYDEIPKVNYAPQGNAKAKLDELKTIHDSRMAKSKYYQFLLEDIDLASTNRKRNYFTLNETAYKAELAKNESKNKEREKLKKELKEKRNEEEGNLILDEAIFLLLSNTQ
jgi:carboxyl-terminal processing protease